MFIMGKRLNAKNVNVKMLIIKADYETDTDYEIN